MKKSKSFYIGWNDKMPDENKSAIQRFLIPIFIVLPILAFMIVYSQKGFNDHQFELGKLTELTGVYHRNPVPILEITTDDIQAPISKHVLLVGYGKFGAEGIMDDLEKEKGSLDGKTITLQGTLIYGDGKTLMELTKKGKSLIQLLPGQAKNQTPLPSFKNLELTGEILDPKCYFGVMKPGDGKIHKSCAIRCISGGIPPVLRGISPDGQQDYYVLLGEKGQKINQDILDKVAEPVKIIGKVSTINGWNVLYADEEEIVMNNEL